MSIPPYAPPSVGPTGLIVSTYQSILADNLQAFLNIYGTNQYVAQDSAIYQLISIFSLKHSDANLGLQLAYNQTSPQTAVGAGLDRVLKLNGLARAPFTYSIAVLTLTGTAGTTITNGFVQDVNGNLWAIPSPVVIIGGSIDVPAQCTTPGNVAASAGTINLISTPVAGWATATNAGDATPGASLETDSKARARQAISVALTAVTPIAATTAAVLAVPGVTRINPLENPTGVSDSFGNPPHSISLVIEGGDQLAVATAIFLKKTIGCFTNGGTTQIVTDPITGLLSSISFFRPTYENPYVIVVVRSLTGFTTATQTAIQAGIVSYLNSLNIGQTILYSELYGAALTARSNPDLPLFSIQAIGLSLFPIVAGNGTISGIISGSPVMLFTLIGPGGFVPAVGMFVACQGVPSGATIINVSGSGPWTITISTNATANVTSTAGTLIPVGGTADIPQSFNQAAKGITSQIVVVVQP